MSSDFIACSKKGSSGGLLSQMVVYNEPAQLVSNSAMDVVTTWGNDSRKRVQAWVEWVGQPPPHSSASRATLPEASEILYVVYIYISSCHQHLMRTRISFDTTLIKLTVL